MVKTTCAHGFHLVLVQRGGLSPVREDGGTVKPGALGRDVPLVEGALRGGGAALRRTPPRNPPSTSGTSRPGASRRYEDKLS